MAHNNSSIMGRCSENMIISTPKMGVLQIGAKIQNGNFLENAWNDFYLNVSNLHRPKSKLNSVVLARKRTMPTELQPHVGEFSASFCG
jgi:hypothetical protein